MGGLSWLTWYYQCSKYNNSKNALIDHFQKDVIIQIFRNAIVEADATQLMINSAFAYQQLFFSPWKHTD